jgi:hypothetical protein
MSGALPVFRWLFYKVPGDLPVILQPNQGHGFDGFRFLLEGRGEPDGGIFPVGNPGKAG